LSGREIPQPLRGALFGLLACALFSVHDAIIKLLGSAFPAVQVVFFAALFTLPWVAALMIFTPSQRNLRPRHPRWMVLRAALSIAVTVSIYFAFAELKLAETYAILFATPLLVTALSAPILKEQVGRWRWIAVATGFVGVLIVLQPGISPIGPGHLAAIAGATGGALVFIVMRKIGRDETMTVMLFYPRLANLLAMAVFLPAIYRPMGASDLGWSALLATFGFLAALCMVSAYRRAPAAIVAPMQYSQILWAILFGTLIFSEKPDANTAVGAAIIIASGGFIMWRENRRA